MTRGKHDAAPGPAGLVRRWSASTTATYAWCGASRNDPRRPGGKKVTSVRMSSRRLAATPEKARAKDTASKVDRAILLCDALLTYLLTY